MSIYVTNNNILSGLFGSMDRARTVVEGLREAGVPDEDISLLSSEVQYPESKYREIDGAFLENTDSAVETGSGAGAAVGGAGGFLVGLSTIAVPGAGALLVVGSVLLSTLAGISVGALTGGVVGLLVELGFSREEAEHFETSFGNGNVLVLAKAETAEQETIRAVMMRHYPINFGTKEKVQSAR